MPQGQTGSGKTFTITGGPDRYEDRGLIPRTLSMIFEQKAARAAELQYSVSISYLGQACSAASLAPQEQLRLQRRLRNFSHVVLCLFAATQRSTTTTATIYWMRTTIPRSYPSFQKWPCSKMTRDRST